MCAVNPFLFLLLLFADAAATVHHTHRFHHGRRGSRASAPQEYLDPTDLAFLLPRRAPSCSLPLLQHDFGDTYGQPPASVPYAPPPGCPAPWARVVLDLSVACAGEQYDRIAAVWIDGAEVIRTSTAEPSEAGIFWHVRKDVTRYAALLRRDEGGVASMMLENIVNDEFTGVYHVNVSLDFYMDEEEEEEESPQLRPQLTLPAPKKEEGMQRNLGKLKLPLARQLGLSSPKAGIPIESAKATPLYKEPADLIIPISNDDSQDGSWFRIKNTADVPFKSIQVPRNAHRAVLEIYVSYHSNDEFWYSNPPNSYIERNNLTTERGNGSFREVYATLDGGFVGSIVPFPVIFTGGINPLFWEPVVALGAFDLPSYDLELTPFLGLLLDGKPHDIGIGVADAISFWLVDANLHLWLDSGQPSVTAEFVQYQAPKISICRRSKSRLLNGKFTIEAGRRFRVSGWVNSSAGNLTTDVSRKLHFKSSVEFTNDGNDKDVRTKARLKTDVTVSDGMKSTIASASYMSKYPLMFMTATEAEEGSSTYTMKTNLSHVLSEEAYVMVDTVESFSSINDEQDADGWMLVEDHSVLAGSSGTRQTYQYEDDSGSYRRRVITKDGLILSDNTTSSYVFFV